MKATIDQYDETEFEPMGRSELRKYQEAFEVDNDGLEADDEEEATADQLQGVRVKIIHGLTPSWISLWFDRFLPECNER